MPLTYLGTSMFALHVAMSLVEFLPPPPPYSLADLGTLGTQVTFQSILFIFIQFSASIMSNNNWASPQFLGCRPSLEKSWIRHWLCFSTNPPSFLQMVHSPTVIYCINDASLLHLWGNWEGDGALIDVASRNRYTSEASISLRQETHPISQTFEWQIQCNSNMKLDQMGHLWCFNWIVLKLYNLRKRSSAHFKIIFWNIYQLWCIFSYQVYCQDIIANQWWIQDFPERATTPTLALGGSKGGARDARPP